MTLKITASTTEHASRIVPHLVRRNPFPQKATTLATPNAAVPGKGAATCGPQCIMLIAGAAAGVLLAVLLVLGVLIYRRRRAQEEEDDMIAEMEDDWRFQPRTMSVSGQGAGGPGRKFSGKTSRKQSVAPSPGSNPAPWSAGGGGYGPSYGGANPNMLARGSRPSLTATNAGGLDLPRRPSRADLAQMDVYRKMSVIGII